MFFSSEDRDRSQFMPQLESLEDRLYLTTLVGGQMFDFSYNDGNSPYSIVARGDIVAEIVGMNFEGNSQTLSGLIRDSAGNILQIVGGGETYNQTLLVVDDVTQGEHDLSQTEVDNTLVIDALATAIEPDSGDIYQTYGLDFNADAASLMLYMINPETGAADLGNGIDLASFGVFPVDANGDITFTDTGIGADFYPTLVGGDMYLYFSIGVEDPVLEEDVTQLYRVKIDPDATSNFASGLEAVGIIDETDSEIGSIAWDDVGGGNALLYFITAGDTEGTELRAIPSGAFSPANPSVYHAPMVRIPLSVIEHDEVTGIGFAGDVSGVGESALYVIQGPELYMVDLNTNTDIQYADLADPNGQDPRLGGVRGANLGGLTWYSEILNPFTGNIGVFMTNDTVTDELLYMDHRLQPTNSNVTEPSFPGLFMVYISHAGPDAQLIISGVQTETGGDTSLDMEPYTGNLTSFTYINTNGVLDPDVTETGPQAGDVLIGITGSLLGLDDTPIIFSGNLDSDTGVVPPYFANNPTNIDIGSIVSGVMMPETLLQPFTGSSLVNSTLNGNIDRTDGVAVSWLDGSIAVIDNDHLDANSETWFTSELSIFPTDSNGDFIPDPDGLPTVNSFTLDVHLIDIAYADLDMDGTEELYALVAENFQDGAMNLAYSYGRIDTVAETYTSLGNFSASTGYTAGISGPISLAFAPGTDPYEGQQTMYLGYNDGTLYEVALDAAGQVNTFVNRGQMVTNGYTSDGELIGLNNIIPESMAVDESGIIYVFDSTYGRLLDISLSGGSLAVGSRTMTEPGTINAMVTGIAYDYINDRFIAIDDSASYLYTGYYNPDGEVADNSSIAVLTGVESDSSVPQAMDRLMIAGTLTGRVDLAGSVDTIYVGWIITGNSAGAETRENISGTFTASDYYSDIRFNFNVDGDVRNLLTMADVGCISSFSGSELTTIFETRTEIRIGGKLGWFGVLGQANMLGELIVYNVTPDGDLDGTNSSYLNNQHEVEGQLESIDYIGHDGSLGDQDGWSFENGLFSSYSQSMFANDSYFSPQYLGTIHTGVDGETGEDDIIRVSGSLSPTQDSTGGSDTFDYYAVSLMAGQTITAQVLLDLNILGPDMTYKDTPFNLRIYDPDWQFDPALSLGNFITSNMSDVDRAATGEQPVRFTATKSGVYRFAIETNLDETTPYIFTIDGVGDLGIGAVTVGSVAAGVGVFKGIVIEETVGLVNGDIGLISAGLGYQFTGADYEDNVYAPVSDMVLASTEVYSIKTYFGNLRSIEANAFTDPADLALQDAYPVLGINGDIGSINAYSIGGLTKFTAFVDGDIHTVYAAGQFWAHIEASGGLGSLYAESMTDSNSSSVEVNHAGVFKDVERGAVVVNLDVDETGDGYIDMWEVGGDMGTFATGGPQIDTGLSGNVRYMKVGGVLYQDELFVGMTPDPDLDNPFNPIESGFTNRVTDVYLHPGETISFVDDSGGIITIELESFYHDPIYGTPLTVPSISYRYYGIRGQGGGGVLVDIVVSGSPTITANSNGNKTPVEIGEIEITQGRLVYPSYTPSGEDEAIMFPDYLDPQDPLAPLAIYDDLGPAYASTDPRPDESGIINGWVLIDGLDTYYSNAASVALLGSTGRNVVDGTEPRSLELQDDTGANIYMIVNGGKNNPVDVFSVVTSNSAQTAGLNMTLIANYTPGELVNVYAASIGLLHTDGTLGFTRDGVFDQAVHSNALIMDATPFSQLHDAVIVTGSIYRIVSAGGVGNVIVSSGYSIGGAGGYTGITNHIGTIVINPSGVVDHSDADTVSFGYKDVYMYRGLVGAVYADGNINNVNIGEGIAPSGSGEGYQAGLFAQGRISYITNKGQGIGSDIYGDIIALDGIGTIELFDGSIINADIVTVGVQGSAQPFAFGWEWVDRGYPADPQDNFWSDLNKIILNGAGGIIGSMIYTGGLDTIKVNNGFGIINCNIMTAGANDSIGSIVADGFGIINCYISAGDRIGSVVARGDGSDAELADYTFSVRNAGGYTADDYVYHPVFGTLANELTDIHVALGEYAYNSSFITGLIANTHIQGTNSIGTVSAFQIVSTPNRSIDGVNLTGLYPDVSYTRGLLSQITAINKISKIVTKDIIDGLTVYTGKIGQFLPKSDVSNLDLNIAGKVNRILIDGNLDGNSQIHTSGPNGYLANLIVRGDMDGEITSTGRIGSVTIDGDLSGSINTYASNHSNNSLTKLVVGGSFMDGSLDVAGNIGSIIVLGSFGIELIVDGDLNQIKVGYGDSTVASVMDASLWVGGDLGKIDILGEFGAAAQVYVDGDLGNMIVRGDDATSGGTIFAGEMEVRGKANNLQLINGSFAGKVIAGVDITKFVLNEGDIASGASIESILGDIGLVDLRDGNLNGQVFAVNGDIKTIRVNGDVNGANATFISSLSLNNFTATGSLSGGAAGVDIDIDGKIDKFTVGGEVDSAMAVAGQSGGNFTFKGNMLGELALSKSDKAASITVDGDLDGSISVASDASIKVQDDMDGSAFIDGDLASLDVRGTFSGDVNVNGEVNKATLGIMDSATLSAGDDINLLKIAGALDNSLVQAGMSIGADGQWQSNDASERSHMATIKQLQADWMGSSIVASTGDISKISIKGGMTNSSISAGLNLGSSAIDAIVNDATPLADALELAAARGAADRELYSGDILNASIGLGGMVGSAITAGVDAGADGDFATAADNNVTSSLVGGQSVIKSLKGDVSADSVVLADTEISRHNGIANGTVDTVDYDLSDIAAEAVGANLKGSATSTSSFTYVTASGFNYTISVVGNGTVHVYDEAGGDTDDIIDLVTISDTDSRTKVYITSNNPDGSQIAKIVSSDDAELALLSVEGDLVGDGTDAVDLWLDGDIKALAVNTIGGEGWAGAIGGDIKTMVISEQQEGSLRIGGDVSRLEVIDGSDSGLFSPVDSFASPSVNMVTMDGVGVGTGRKFAWDSTTGEFYQFENYAGASVIEDAFGNSLTLQAMDATEGGVIYVVASMSNPIPSLEITNPDLIATSAEADFVDLASDGSSIYTVASSYTYNGVTADWLFEIDSETGAQTVIGALRDRYGNVFNGNVQAIAFDGDQLLAIVDDANGQTADTVDITGDSIPDPITSLISIAVTDDDSDGYVRVAGPGNDIIPRTLSDSGDYRTMTIDGGTIYVVRREVGEDILDTVEISSGNVTAGIAVNVEGNDTNIIGIGFDSDDNLVAYNDDGFSAELLVIDTVDPSASAYASVPGSLISSMSGFAFAGNKTYAYKLNAGAGANIYQSPEGEVSTLSKIEDADVRIVQLLPAMVDDDGELVEITLAGMSLDEAGTGNAVIMTESNQMYFFSVDDGSLQSIGQVGYSDGSAIDIVDIDFNNTTGELLGIDAQNNQIVNINTTSGVVTGRTLPGTVDAATLTGIIVDDEGENIYLLDSGNNQYVQADLKVQDQGIIANSIAQIIIGNDDAATGYAASILSEVGDIKSISIKNDFSGYIYADGKINSVKMQDGDFSGSIVSGGLLGSFKLKDGDIGISGLVKADEIRSLNITGDLYGGISAGQAGSLVVDGDNGVDNSDASVDITRNVKKLQFAGDFYGDITVLSAENIYVKSLMGYASITTISGANSIRITEGAGADSTITSYAHVNNIVIGGTLEGVVSVMDGVGSFVVDTMDHAIVAVAGDTGGVRVGYMDTSLFTSGIYLGADGIYNTEDDEIIGGSINSVVVQNRMLDSAFVAGVLPDLSAGSGDAALANMLYFTGSQGSNDMTIADSARSGGLLYSNINRMVVRDVGNSNPNSGLLSVAVAADEIGKIKIRTQGASLETRTYDDVYGAVKILEEVVSYHEEIDPGTGEPTGIWLPDYDYKYEYESYVLLSIYFDGEINTASITASHDGDGDGFVDGVSDFYGTFTITDANGDINSDVTFTYLTYENEQGDVRSIVQIRCAEGFNSYGNINGILDIDINDRTVEGINDRMPEVSWLSMYLPFSHSF